MDDSALAKIFDKIFAVQRSSGIVIVIVISLEIFWNPINFKKFLYYECTLFYGLFYVLAVVVAN